MRDGKNLLDEPHRKLPFKTFYNARVEVVSFPSHDSLRHPEVASGAPCPLPGSLLPVAPSAEPGAPRPPRYRPPQGARAGQISKSRKRRKVIEALSGMPAAPNGDAAGSGTPRPRRHVKPFAECQGPGHLPAPFGTPSGCNIGIRKGLGHVQDIS